MKNQAQAGLEYLVTYGWALVLIATFIGAMIFVISGPVDSSTFSSDDPDKLFVRGGSVLDGMATIKLQNITGGTITLTDLLSTGYYDCLVNGEYVQPEGITIGPGGELLVQCNDIENETGEITITYTDPTGLEQEVTITINGPEDQVDTDPGAGTLGDPYKIRDCTGLQAMDQELDAYYVLVRNINCSETTGWNGGLGFDPVGVLWGNSFEGSLDGANHTITGLYINRPGEQGVGLFKNFEGEVNNLGMIGSNITGDRYVGGISGYSMGTTTNCYNTGSISGGNYVGGIAGYTQVLITDSYNTGSINGSNNVGGIAGETNNGSIENSYNNGSVSGNDTVGGIVGYNNGGTYTSYNTGSINGNTDVGGVAGSNWSTMANVYNTGLVDGSSGIGGVVGFNTSPLSKSYNVGLITGNSEVGGIVGGPVWGDSPIDSYYLDSICDACDNVEGTDLTDSEMRNEVSYTNWDFATIWNSPNGNYPTLQ